MLKEGKSGRMSTFVVHGVDKNNNPYGQTVRATSAQSAVDYCRKTDPDYEIIEVWKVVNNWK